MSESYLITGHFFECHAGVLIAVPAIKTLGQHRHVTILGIANIFLEREETVLVLVP